MAQHTVVGMMGSVPVHYFVPVAVVVDMCWMGMLALGVGLTGKLELVHRNWSVAAHQRSVDRMEPVHRMVPVDRMMAVAVQSCSLVVDMRLDHSDIRRWLVVACPCHKFVDPWAAGRSWSAEDNHQTVGVPDDYPPYQAHDLDSDKPWLTNEMD